MVGLTEVLGSLGGIDLCYNSGFVSCADGSIAIMHGSKSRFRNCN